MLIYVLAFLLLLPVLFALFISFLLKQSVVDMAGGLELKAVDIETEYPEFSEEIRECDAWAQAQGFRYVGGYHTVVANIENVFAAWKHESRPSYLVRYHAGGKVFYDFVTLFMGRLGLTTSSTQDGQLLPKPHGEYVQSFDGELGELLNRHAEAEAYLVREAGLKEQWVDRSLPDLINESIIRQMAYVQSLPLWQFRGFWWYFLRRGKMHGRSVQELHEAGLAPFPKDPTFKAIDV